MLASYFAGSFILRQIKKQNPLCKDCNIVWISLDTLSAKHLPCYGYPRNTAPNLCKFAQENIRFANAYSNSFWTLPSSVSEFTGLYPETHKVITYNDVLNGNTPFLPQILQKNGYTTLFGVPLENPAIPVKNALNRGIDKYLNEFQLDIQKETTKFQEANTEYQADLQHKIEQARLDQERLVNQTKIQVELNIQNAKNEADIAMQNAIKSADTDAVNKAKSLEAEIMNKAKSLEADITNNSKELERQITEYQATLSKYQGDREDYASKVQKEVGRVSTLIQQYSSMGQSYIVVLESLKQEFKQSLETL